MANALPILSPELEPSLRIGDLAKKAGKSTRAVRLYEEKGLLGPALRTDGGHRLYAESALVRLDWIEKLQILGLSLGEIRAFVDDLNSAEAAPAAMGKVRRMFEVKLAEVRRQLSVLRDLEGELLHGVEYLDSCNTCAPSTAVTACKTCGQPHPVEPPPLVTGIHQGGEGNQS